MSDPSHDDLIANALERLQAQDTNTQIRLLADRVGQIASDTAVHRERDGAMADKFDKMEVSFEKIEKKFDELENKVIEVQRTVESLANKWKGGTAVILLAGTIIGAVATFWDKISPKLFGH